MRCGRQKSVAARAAPCLAAVTTAGISDPAAASDPRRAIPGSVRRIRDDAAAIQPAFRAAARETADQTTLAADIALDRTTTTGALKRLAARNFVERAVDDEDRRARLCKLTPAGAALLAKIEASARAAHRATLDNLSEREQAAFVDMMQRIVAAHSIATALLPYSIEHQRAICRLLARTA